MEEKTEDETVIHIGTVMKVLGERKTFIKNHPDFLGFVLQVFGGELGEGTVLEVRVTRPKQEAGDDASEDGRAKAFGENDAGNGVENDTRNGVENDAENDVELKMVGRTEQGRVELRASDMGFFHGVRELVREIVKE